MGGIILDHMLQDLHNASRTLRFDFGDVRLTRLHHDLRTAL